MQGFAVACDSVRISKVDGIGLERLADAKAETVVGAELYASLYAHDPRLARLIGCWPRLTDEDRQVLVDQAVQLATEQNERQQTVSHSFVEEPVQTKESFGRDAIGSRR